MRKPGGLQSGRQRTRHLHRHDPGVVLLGGHVAQGHGRRLEIYNLYHLLNHANLFGGGYWRQAQASIDALMG